jgi:hypothetical protein
MKETMNRFNECKRTIMTTHQCIDCMVADRCDDPYAEKEGRRIQAEHLISSHNRIIPDWSDKKS